MPNDHILPSSVTTVGLAARGKDISFLDKSTLVYASGNGLVLQSVESGSQRHLWGLGAKNFGGSSGPALHASCPQKKMMAWVQNSMAGAELQVLAIPELQVLATIKSSRSRGEWQMLTFSHDGAWLLTISGSPLESGESQHDGSSSSSKAVVPGERLDVWNLKATATAAAAAWVAASANRSNASSMRGSETGSHRSGYGAARPSPSPVPSLSHGSTTLSLGSEAHVNLGGDRLSQVGVAFFPINPMCFCSVGARGVLLMHLEGAMGSHIVRKSSVNLSALHETETMCSFCWTPNGSLILGTSEGRLLLVKNAAPTAIPSEQWGPTAGANVTGHTAEVLRTAGDNVGAVLHVTVTQTFIVTVYSGGLDACSSMVLLDSHDPNTRPAITCPLPGLQEATFARLSPFLDSLIMRSRDGLLAHFRLHLGRSSSKQGGSHRGGLDGWFPEVPAMVGSGDVTKNSSDGGEGKEEATPPGMLSCRILGCFHSDCVTAVATLPKQRVLSGSADGSVRLWQSSSTGGSTEVAAGGTAATTARLLGYWSIGQQVTTVLPYVAGNLSHVFLVGSSGGHLMLLNSDHPELMLSAIKGSGSTGAAAAQELALMVATSPRVSSWDLHAVQGPISATAFSPDGAFCAASCRTTNQIVFFKVMRTNSEVNMQLLGFYNIRDPRVIAFAPILPGGEPMASMLVVATGSGEIQVLSVPRGAFVNRNKEALITEGSLCIAYMRCQSGITAMATSLALPEGVSGRSSGSGAGKGSTVQPGSIAPLDRSTFWLWVACCDKSMKRFRMLTDLQMAAAQIQVAAAAAAATAAASDAKPPTVGGTRAGMVNFTLPETERVMELHMPAAQLTLCSPHAPLPSLDDSPMALMPVQQHPQGQLLVVASLDGAVSVYSLPDMQMQVRWPLHDMTAGGCISASMCPGLLVSAGVDSTIQLIELDKSYMEAKPARVARAKAALAGQSTSGALLTERNGAMQPFADSTEGIMQNQRAGKKLANAGKTAAAKSSLQAAMMDEVAVLQAPVAGILDWKESRFQVQVMGKALENKAFKELMAAKTSLLEKRLADLVERERMNDGAGDKPEADRLTADEWVIDTQLAKMLRGEADVRVGSRKARLKKDMLVPQVILERSHALCWDSAEVQQRKITNLPEHTFVSPLTADDLKRWKDIGPVVKLHEVSNYPIQKLSAQEARRLRKIKFLRQVEQCEWETRPVEKRGVVVSLQRYTGQMAGKVNWDTDGLDMPAPALPAANAAASTSATPRDVKYSDTGSNRGGDEGVDPSAAADNEDSPTTPRGPAIEGATVENGMTKLLYSNMQLHTLHRKVAQVALLKEEVRTMQRVFNSKVKDCYELKQKEISRIEERLNRIADIQATLVERALQGADEEEADAAAAAAAGPPAGYGYDPSEDVAALLEVHDSEVTVPKYVSPEDRKRLAEEQRIADEMRRLADADDAKQRALREMMNGKVAIRKQKDGAVVLKREAWMDLPRAQMSKEQRLKLIEFDKSVTEAAEEEEKLKRLLESERKALEIEVFDTVVDFNNALYGLREAKIGMDVECHSLELQQVVLAAATEVNHHAEARSSHSATLLTHLAVRTEKRNALSLEIKKLLSRVQRQYDTLHTQEKTMDKVFRREFGSREDIYEEVAKVYRDRRHALSGAHLRSAVDLLARTPEGAVPQRSPAPSPMPGDRSTASRMMDEELSLGQCEGDTVVPSLLPALERWVEEGQERVEGPSDIVPPTPRTPAGSMDQGGPIGALRAMATTGRPLEPVLECLLEGTPLHTLGVCNPGLLGLGLPDVHGSLDPFVSPTLHAMFEPTAARLMARTKLDDGEAPLSLSPWDPSTQKPDGLDDAWWLRLMEFRDTRILLEKQAIEAWDELCDLVVSLEAVDREVGELSAQVTAVVTRQQQLKNTIQTALLDLGLVYRMTNGQVEVPMTGMKEASFLKLSRVERLNDAIIERGTCKVEMLCGVKDTKQDIYMAEWENEAGQLMIRHKIEVLKELQLLHVTKELQAAMRDPDNVGKMDQEAAMLTLLEGSKNSHRQRRELRLKALARLTERVATNIEVHQALTLTEKSSSASFAECSSVNKIMSHNRTSDDDARKRHLKNVVTNKQLQDISVAQAQELQQLAREMALLEERAYPSLTPQVPMTYGADVVLPTRYGGGAPLRSTMASRSGMGSRNGSRRNAGSRPGIASNAAGQQPGTRNTKSSMGSRDQAGPTGARTGAGRTAGAPTAGAPATGGVLQRKLQSR